MWKFQTFPALITKWSTPGPLEILCFDVSDEVFQIIELPELAYNDDSPQLRRVSSTCRLYEDCGLERVSCFASL